MLTKKWNQFLTSAKIKTNWIEDRVYSTVVINIVGFLSPLSKKKKTLSDFLVAYETLWPSESKVRHKNWINMFSLSKWKISSCFCFYLERKKRQKKSCKIDDGGDEEGSYVMEEVKQIGP